MSSRERRVTFMRWVFTHNNDLYNQHWGATERHPITDNKNPGVDFYIYISRATVVMDVREVIEVKPEDTFKQILARMLLLM